MRKDKEVHKTLDFVGWFTLASPAGLGSHHLPIHNQILSNYNESALLLTFHPSSLADGSTKGGRLPLTVYENVWETASDDGDKQMQSGGEGPSLVLRFRELPYTIETGDAEMIGVDFVAKGGANAAALPNNASKGTNDTPPQQTKTKGKGKAKASDADGQPNGIAVQEQVYLSPEEEETIVTLTTKANAIRMLRQRITLIKSYLNSLPPCYLNDPSIQKCEPHPQISHAILRSIAALLARLPLLTPSTPAQNSRPTNQQAKPPGSLFAQESAAQAADVALVSLLGQLGDTLQLAQQVEKKYVVVEQARAWGPKSKGGIQVDPHVGGDGGSEGAVTQLLEVAQSMGRRFD